MLEAFSRWNHAVAISWVAHENLCLNNLYRNGTEEQRLRYLPGLCDGTRIGALALTEPGAGSDAIGSMRTTARRSGDDYLLNGTKLFITNGPVADVLIVYRQGGECGQALGRCWRSSWKRDSPASTRPDAHEDGVSRKQDRGAVFQDCRVPAENLLGGEHGGLRS